MASIVEMMKFANFLQKMSGITTSRLTGPTSTTQSGDDLRRTEIPGDFGKGGLSHLARITAGYHGQRLPIQRSFALDYLFEHWQPWAREDWMEDR
jgi:hypothetical protein